MNVLSMPRLELDANGLPKYHEQALWLARQEHADWISELPEHVFHVGPTDVELGTERIIARYWLALQQMQRAR